MRIFAVALAVLASAVALPAAAQPRCDRQTFAISGDAVTVTACAAPPASGEVAVAETVARGAATSTHTATIALVSGAAVSRGVDDLPLAPLGLSGTLHLALAYRNGAATIEHAMLLPSAIPLK